MRHGGCCDFTCEAATAAAAGGACEPTATEVFGG
jgi:hypothetical protein